MGGTTYCTGADKVNIRAAGGSTTTLFYCSVCISCNNLSISFSCSLISRFCSSILIRVVSNLCSLASFCNAALTCFLQSLACFSNAAVSASGDDTGLAPAFFFLRFSFTEQGN